MSVATVVLGSPAGDPLMKTLALAIEAAGIPIVTVALDPAVKDDAVHEARFRAALAGLSGQPIIGGFSVGGRIGARICLDTSAIGLLCFGYPFHRARDGADRHGLDALLHVTVPARVIQGTRDNHGTEAEVKRYPLPDSVEMVWLEDGNHRFVPRKGSRITPEEHIETAAAAAISFIRSR